MTAHSSSFATRLLVHKQLLLLFVPTVFDMLGSAMLNVGLLSVTASATAMLRQSLLVFAAVLAVGLWGKRLNRYHAAGLLGCLVRASNC
jgi:drug/metabolite transporter (DMT)-like permease